MIPSNSSKKAAKTKKSKANGVKNGKASKETAKNRHEEEGQEVARAEIRTTQAGRGQPEPKVYPYRNGCPQCSEKSLVTEQKIRGWRVCRCRECCWRGEMEG